MKDNSKTNTLLLTVIGVATLLVAVIGATFAYFTAQVGGGETETTVKMNAGVLKINFADTNSVDSATGFQPTAAAVECPDKKVNETTAYLCDQSQYSAVGTKTFTLTGTNTTLASDNMKMPYTIKLVISKNEFSTGALKYTLTGTKSSGSVGTNELVNETDWVDISTGEQTITLGSGYFTSGTNILHSYTLNIYFPDNHIVQDIDKNKVFTGKIEVSTSQITNQ